MIFPEGRGNQKYDIPILSVRADLYFGLFCSNLSHLHGCDSIDGADDVDLEE